MVNAASITPASVPPSLLSGLDPEWSRIVATPKLDHAGRTWHLLDNQVVDPTLTLLCVHGNPTWSYMWRDLIARAPGDVRVIAIDHLDMGYSERTGTIRRLAQRIEDLCALTDELNLTGPVVTVGHDWGGPISLGWAQQNQSLLAGIVLMNTAVHQPEGSRAPSLIRAVRPRGIRKSVCETTPTFIRGTMALARPSLPTIVRGAYEDPYRTAERRAAIGAFVEDIPLTESHPSHHVLNEIAAGLDELADVPALLLWGTSDPVFTDLHLNDLVERLPAAAIHRFVGSGHLLPEDADIGGVIFPWVVQLGVNQLGADELDSPSTLQAPASEREPLWAALDRRTADDVDAILEMGSEGREASITFSDLDRDVRRVAAGLIDLGVSRGDRVALLVLPGIDLAVCIFACWRMGAVVVLTDAGLGARGMGRALASAKPAYLIGIPKAVTAASVLGWPGIRISTAELSRPQKRLLKIEATLDDLRTRGTGQPLPETPTALDEAAIAFTSGATGPAKGVLYRHHQLQAQRDALVALYGIGEGDSLVAAFGPFSLFGPLMGIPSVVPDMNVTSPGTLTANALAEAIDAVQATLAFASPAALLNVGATAEGVNPVFAAALEGVRVLISAGAPVPASVLRSARAIMPNADPHTPYGMTELMPVADISLDEIEAAGLGNGVCVGMPTEGVEVLISELDEEGEAVGPLSDKSGVTGEVCVRAAHMRERYDKLWGTSHAASQPPGWHRSGDVGHFDEDGQLWIEGRMVHIVTTAHGPVTPVGIEIAVSLLDDVAHTAVVGVGPPGAQAVVVVVVPGEAGRRGGLAGEELADRVRAQAGGLDIAAVLLAPSLPVDVRHNSKIDRTRIAQWAERVLAGGRIGRI